MEHLEKQTYPWEHVWTKERITPRDLADACHLAEATSTLPLAPISNRLTQPALDWLAGLSSSSRGRPLKDETLRFYPNRLKTLALLDAFTRHPAIRSDFATLSSKFSEHEAKIRLEPNPTEMQADLITLVWLDTLLNLQDHKVELFEWQHAMALALDALESSMEHLINSDLPAGDFALDSPRDASYAFDLLIHANRLEPGSALYNSIVSNLTNQLRQQPPRRALEPGHIYAAIQLTAHAPHEPFVLDTVQLFLRHARETDLARAREPISHAALLLRLLTTFHGARLKRVIEEILWERMRDVSDEAERTQQLAHDEDLMRLLQNHFFIQLGRHEPLGEGHQTRIYRVHFRFNFGVRFVNDTRNHDLPMNVVVKQGPLPALLRAADAYDALPSSLKPLFAAHGQPEAFDRNPRSVWYLLMHDLEGYNTLHQELEALEQDNRRLFYRQQAQLAGLAQHVARALNAIHRESKALHSDSHTVNNLYLAPLNRHLGELSRHSFPGLRQLMYAEFKANDTTYGRLGKYLSGLRRHQDKLRPPQLGLIHGDCHSRNVMLNEGGDVKFIDLENLETENDYLLDYAILFEDVALYRFIQGEDITLEFPTASEEDSASKQIPRVRYPNFNSSFVALRFQEQLLQQLDSFATSIGDKNWRARLWLATARALTLLSARRFVNPRLPGVPSEQDSVIAMLYAETIRLLDELLAYLDGHQELPQVLFPGVVPLSSAD